MSKRRIGRKPNTENPNTAMSYGIKGGHPVYRYGLKGKRKLSKGELGAKKSEKRSSK